VSRPFREAESADPKLALTGERTVPGIARENYWFRRHLVVYEALAPRCRGVVLEAGCGTGYFSHLLQKEQGWPVVPMDIAGEETGCRIWHC